MTETAKIKASMNEINKTIFAPQLFIKSGGYCNIVFVKLLMK